MYTRNRQPPQLPAPRGRRKTSLSSPSFAERIHGWGQPAWGMLATAQYERPSVDRALAAAKSAPRNVTAAYPPQLLKARPQQVRSAYSPPVQVTAEFSQAVRITAEHDRPVQITSVSRLEITAEFRRPHARPPAIEHRPLQPPPPLPAGECAVLPARAAMAALPAWDPTVDHQADQDWDPPWGDLQEPWADVQDRDGPAAIALHAAPAARRGAWLPHAIVCLLVFASVLWLGAPPDSADGTNSGNSEPMIPIHVAPAPIQLASATAMLHPALKDGLEDESDDRGDQGTRAAARRAAPDRRTGVSNRPPRRRSRIGRSGAVGIDSILAAATRERRPRRSPRRSAADDGGDVGVTADDILAAGAR